MRPRPLGTPAPLARLLAVCPSVRRDGRLLIADTGAKAGCLTLGLRWRRVECDPERKELRITTTWAYVFRRTRRIPFAAIGAIAYEFTDANPIGAISWTHESWDAYRVGIRRHGQSRAEWLFTFVGEGSFVNRGPFPDWWYWRDIVFDAEGSQEAESRHYVRLLADAIGCRVG